jgi:hypothetical protein
MPGNEADEVCILEGQLWWWGRAELKAGDHYTLLQSSKPLVLKLNMHQMHRFLGLTLRVSGLKSLGWDLRKCIFNKFLDDTHQRTR